MSESIQFDSLIGKGTGPRSLHYTWRDVALYALAVGSTEKDLPYVYEKDSRFSALPTFGLVPYLNSILTDPLTHEPKAPNESVRDFVISKLKDRVVNFLHMGMELVIHKPIDPYEGTLLIEDRLEGIYDRGEGKGIVAKVDMDIYNRAGVPAYTLHSDHYVGAFGGFGGEKYTAQTVNFPDRAPDYTITEYLSGNIAALYRLMGDTAAVHIDPAAAGRVGYAQPFLHGLCTYGFAARMGLQAIAPYAPERVTRVRAQMRSVVFPGQNVTFLGWELEPGRVGFRLLGADGKALLDHGLLEYTIH